MSNHILDVAARRKGMPYRIDPPPDGVNNVDCSLFVLLTFRDAGLPFPPGVRTAEQIRQRCTPGDFGDVEPGMLLFFEHTYEPNEPPGPDGHVASHVGISLGTGSLRMWDANEANGVGVTNIGTPYWQSKIFQAARPKQVQASPPPVIGEPIDVLHRARWEGMGIGYNPRTAIATFWKTHPELGVAVSIEVTLDDGRPAQAFAGGIVVVEKSGARIL